MIWYFCKKKLPYHVFLIEKSARCAIIILYICVKTHGEGASSMASPDNYGASSITVLEGLEAVRKRPGMYIGSVSTKGLNHLIYEIVDNAVDEHLAGFCSRIDVYLEKDGSATIVDDGRGIPIDMHEKGVSAERVVFTTLHAGGKFDDSAYKTSGGLHGVGSSVVNALSTYLTVRVCRGGNIYFQTLLHRRAHRPF